MCTPLAPVHGNWGAWKDDTVCDRTCGVGTVRRSRNCNNPPPSKNGRLCLLSQVRSNKNNKYKDTEVGFVPCNIPACSTTKSTVSLFFYSYTIILLGAGMISYYVVIFGKNYKRVEPHF